MMKYWLLISILVMSCSKGVLDNEKSVLFESIPSGYSGVDFSNEIQEDVTSRENLLDFDYFYNGGGVGIADLNNDGLPDLFFCGNQVQNRLYLNQGNFKFEDVSEKSGITMNNQWSNGVTFADVNSDGYLDIYVSQGGPRDRSDRKNLLFINQKDLTFLEAAEGYGLADQGISTQSVFFDYDKDGDLDCFVMNESELYGYDPIRFHQLHQENLNTLYVSLSHLYKNDKNHFTDVSFDAGIDKPTFGLGLVISDINDDGWLDIYVANDYYLPDNLYINRKNGTFSDRSKNHLRQMSFFGMGADIGDINNDGFQDIYVLDMASKDHYRSKTLMASMDLKSFDLLVKSFQFPRQYMFNTLQLNDGNNRFYNIAHQSKTAKTDWSWSVLINDVDQDGNNDIFVSNGYRRYALDNDFKNKVTKIKREYNGNVPLEVKRKLYAEMPTEALPNILFQNNGHLSFQDKSAQWGLTENTYSNGAAYGDLDRDGDLDLIINNMDQKALVYKNLASDQSRGNYLNVRILGSGSESFAKVRITYGDEIQFAEIKRVRGYMSSVEPIAHFGLGKVNKVDELTVKFTDGTQVIKKNVNVNQEIQINSEEADQIPIKEIITTKKVRMASPLGYNLNYHHRENEYNDFAKEVLLPQKQSTLGPLISVGDFNGDSWEDLYLPGAVGQAGVIYLQKEGQFALKECLPCQEDKFSEDMGSVIFDADGDGDNDLFILSGGNSFEPGNENYQDRLYINDGNGNFTKAGNALFYENAYSGMHARVVDFDRDGDNDLFVGNRILPQHYPESAPSFLLENEGGIFTDVSSSVIPDLAHYGIINDIAISDINNDDWLDILVVGEWESPGIFVNERGRFEKLNNDGRMDSLKGWWFSIHETDLNGDGLPDFLLGNVGLNIKHKASVDKPFKVYANDFDHSGSLDIVLSSDYKGEYVPVRGRECSSQQMPFILDKFPSYDQYASASLEDIYGRDELKSAYQKEATEFRSIVLINNGNESFKVSFLPAVAQTFPLLDAIFEDFNGDGIEDALVAGCIYDTEVETPRLDGGSGLVLLSDGKSGYQISRDPAYKVYIEGQVKCLEKINISSGEQLILAGKNDDVLSVIKIER